MNSHLDEKTLEKRLKMAHSFYENQFDGEFVSAEQTQERLEDLSTGLKITSWRNLRAAVACFWWQKGRQDEAKQIRKTRRRMAQQSATKVTKKRCKKISDDDWTKLLEAAGKSKNKLAFATLILGMTTGMRPMEMTQFRPTGSNSFFISSTKKRSDRGLDREIVIEDPKWAKTIHWAHTMTAGNSVRSLQTAFDYLVNKTFPSRKSKPTIYTMRHQFGSNLKCSDLDRKTVAYLMGHRVTASVNKYGDKRMGGSGLPFTVKPAISAAEIDALVIENHNRHFPVIASHSLQKTRTPR